MEARIVALENMVGDKASCVREPSHHSEDSESRSTSSSPSQTEDDFASLGRALSSNT